MILTSTRFCRRPSGLPGQLACLDSKELLPGSEIQPRLCHRSRHLAAPHAKHSGVRSGSGTRRRSCPPWTGVLSRTIVLALADRRLNYETLQPHFVVGVQAPVIVIDEQAGCNVVRVYRGQRPLYHIPRSSY